MRCILLLLVFLLAPAVALRAESGPDVPDAVSGASPRRYPPPPPARQLPTLVQAWKLASGGKQAALAHATADRVYVLTGEYLEHGTPSHTLLGLDAATGKVRFRYRAGGKMLRLVGVHPRALALKDREGRMFFVNPDTGANAGMQKSTAVTPGHDGTALVGGLRCSLSGVQVRCADASGKVAWQHAEARRLALLWHDAARVCYAMDHDRTISCRDHARGELLFRHAVKPVPGVKEPGAVNFSFALTARHLVLANYDGEVSGWRLP